MLNEKARIQSELTITKFQDNNFYVLSSTASELRDLDWLIQHKEENEDAWISANLLGGGVNEDDKKLDEIDRSKRWDKFSPWGSGDAKAAADSIREGVDTSMALGEQYMVGSALATVYQETDGNI